MNQLVSNYLKISNDIGQANPIPELLSCLSAGIKTCSISAPTETLSDGQVIALCAVLPLSTIDELTFHNLNLNINSWTAIADACSKSKALQKLYFKDCAFKEGQGLAAFARAVGSAEVQVLDIANCKLGDEFAATLADSALLRGDKLSTLRLAACNVSDDGVMKLAKSLESVGMMSSLKVMDLSYNRIGDKGACALAAMLVAEGVQSSLPLQALELEGNIMTDVGGLALARAAKGALVMSRLNISLNNLTDATLHALAEALRFNTGTLKEVAAAGARASEDAAVALIRAAARNNSLQLLDLRGVPLGAEGVAQLCQMLRYTATLNTLRVDVESREGAEAIARELPNNRSLMHLTIGGPVPETLLAQMSEILAANTMRHASTSPARSSPHIHAWIENAALGKSVSGHAALSSRTHHQRSSRTSNTGRSRSPSPGPGPGLRSPRSEAGGSVYSHGTYTTQRTARTATTYLSFQFSQMSRKTGISSSPLRISTSLAAGGAAEKAAVIFRKHDVNQDNYLNRDEMLAALQEVGVFNGIRANKVGRLLDHEFKKADWDNDGKISLQDFISYYEKIAYYQTQLAREGRIRSASHKHAIPVGTENNIALKRVFKNYCKFALGQGRVYAQDGVPHMNAQQFHRLCQDAGFVEPEGRLSTTGVDVVFYRYRPSGARRLGFKEFVEALAAVAYEAGLQFEDVMIALGCRGPNPLTPDGSARNSEAGAPLGGARATQEELLGDPSFVGAFGASGLEAIQEVPTPLAGGAAGGPGAKGVKKGKKKKGTATTGGPSAVSNPLFESTDGRQVLTSSFDLSGAKAVNAKNVQAINTASIAAETRYRMELEARLAQLEGKMTLVASSAFSSQSANAAGGVTGADAGAIAGRLSKLEATLSQAVVKQDELDGVSRQMEGLQSILSKLAEEMGRMKAQGVGSSPERVGSVGGVDASAHAALARQVESLSSLVGQLAGDVRSATGRLDGLAAQVASLALEQRALAAQRTVGGSVGGASGAVGASSGGLAPDALAAFEKRFMDRQARFEGALMQVARQVDVLDAKLKEEQENSLKALETIIATSQGGAAPNSMGGHAVVQGVVPVMSGKAM